MIQARPWRPGTERGYGLLLPHFGRGVTRERLLEGARLAEKAGIDAVFVRDHIAFRPRVVESDDRDYLDAFVVLSAVAAVTQRLVLGTAVLIPHRHPLLTALLLGSLERIAGDHRVLPVWGLGGIDREFDAIGMGGWDRRALLRENVEIIRGLADGRPMDHTGQFYRFQDVDIHPTLEGGASPMWYGGTSVHAVRRAAEMFDGWSAGNMPGRDYLRLRRRLEQICIERGRDVLPTSITPFVSPGRTVEEGAAHVSVERMSKDFQRERYHPPAGTEYRSIEEFDDAVLVGPAPLIAEGIQRHHDRGVQLVIFDLRLRARDWEECLAFIGEEVLPLVRPN